MDYVSLAAHGIGNAVAPLGTAMTEEQAALIARYAPRAILLYDSDKAGLKATFRNGDQLLRAGVEVLVATLPEGEDPDSLVRAQGEWRHGTSTSDTCCSAGRAVGAARFSTTVAAANRGGGTAVSGAGTRRASRA